MPNLDGRGPRGSPGVESFLKMMTAQVTETPMTPGGSQEDRILLLEGEVSRLKEENNALNFSIRNLEAAVFGQSQPSAKKQKH